jgi:hypothetical protein
VDSFWQAPEFLVYVNIALPAEIPVTKPLASIVAMLVLLLDHVPPPWLAFNVEVFPIHKLLFPVIITPVFSSTVTVPVAFDIQPLLLVNVNVAVPAPMPVTKPAFVTDATAVLLLVHVPPVLGLNWVVDNLHIAFGPSMETVGFASTMTTGLGFDTQLVVLLVYINDDVPADKPVTKPPFVTDAIDGLVLIHVPPVVGLNVVVWF